VRPGPLLADHLYLQYLVAAGSPDGRRQAGRRPDGRRTLAGPRAVRHDELDGAEDEQPQHDHRGADDPGRLDLDVAVNRLAVAVVAGPDPPDHERVDEIEDDGDDDRRRADR